MCEEICPSSAKNPRPILPDDWPRWRRRYEQFHVASGLMDADENAASEHPPILYWKGGRVRALIYRVTADERKQYATVMAKFDEFFW